MKAYDYLIVGGGLAGQRGAENARKIDEEGSIALVAVEDRLPYHRPPLSKEYLRGEEPLEEVYVKGAGFYQDRGIELHLGLRAERLDPASRQVALADGRVLGYGKLLLATGGRAWRLPIPGVDLDNVFTLRRVEDAQAIRAAAEGGERAVVIGGSFIGSEVAASLAQLGLEVTMVFPESHLQERVAPEELGIFLHQKYAAQGVRILPGNKPARFEGKRQVERVRLEGGEVLKADLVVMGVGIRLNTELAREAGLELNEEDAVVVNEYLRSSDPRIYAAGDIAAWPDATFGQRLQVEHWDVARRQGIRVGRNMAGSKKPYTALPYFFSDIFDLSWEVWGNLGRWDQTVLRGSLEGESYAFYYFDRGTMVGVLAQGRPDTERDLVPDLVRARLLYAEAADRLADEGADLAALVEG